jgi:transketolase-like protein
MCRIVKSLVNYPAPQLNNTCYWFASLKNNMMSLASAAPSPEIRKDQDIDQLSINTLRMLSIDMVQKAYSGHHGLPLGAAPMAYVYKIFFKK